MRCLKVRAKVVQSFGLVISINIVREYQKKSKTRNWISCYKTILVKHKRSLLNNWMSLNKRFLIDCRSWKKYRLIVGSYTCSAQKIMRHSSLPVIRFKQKDFLFKIVTGDEKWILYENPKKKIMCLSWRTINVNYKTEYSLEKSMYVMYLVEYERCIIFRVLEKL